ncbi:MAG TPA: DUF1573 domain-containing protein [Thermoanaerobaculia bacterium]|nr:DUF1573 domain-containing protein [Thermoanaerobaculia bacterium]
MSDDFGTVNVRPQDRAREIEVVRKRYRRHREALIEMAADAPTENLASEYRRLIQDIDVALAKVDELEGRTPSDTQPMKTAPGTRPLVTPPSAAAMDDEPASAQSRLILIVIAGLVVLAIIGWLIWRASSDERPVTPVVETVETTETVEEEVQPAAPPPAAALAVEPPAHDYGVVRKGTRAARQFEIVNTTDGAITVSVARSACRCLYYDYADTIPAQGRETLTVTIDGAKAEAGALQETVRVTSERTPSAATSFDVTATIQ